MRDGNHLTLRRRGGENPLRLVRLDRDVACSYRRRLP